jgi:hypothetical protein
MTAGREYQIGKAGVTDRQRQRGRSRQVGTSGRNRETGMTGIDRVGIETT